MSDTIDQDPYRQTGAECNTRIKLVPCSNCSFFKCIRVVDICYPFTLLRFYAKMEQCESGIGWTRRDQVKTQIPRRVFTFYKAHYKLFYLEQT